MKKQPTLQSFEYTNHGTGAAAIAAKKIAKGETIRFDLWKIKRSIENVFSPIEREYIKTVYIGLDNIKDNDGTMKKCLRCSSTTNLNDHLSFSLIPTWKSEYAEDPVFIAAEISAYMCINKIDNYFVSEQ